VGYQILAEGGEPMDLDNGVKERLNEGGKDLKVIYLLDGGLMSTGAMAKKDLKIGDEEVGILNRIPAWE